MHLAGREQHVAIDAGATDSRRRSSARSETRRTGRGDRAPPSSRRRACPGRSTPRPGNVTSGVMVANATRSMSPTASPAFASASCAGATASSDGPIGLGHRGTRHRAHSLLGRQRVREAENRGRHGQLALSPIAHACRGRGQRAVSAECAERRVRKRASLRGSRVYSRLHELTLPPPALSPRPPAAGSRSGRAARTRAG